MISKIQLKRGNSSNISKVTLSDGEPLFSIDTNKLYIGNGNKKVVINDISKPVSVNTSNFYTKVKVNDYGQVTDQASLIASDLPPISTSNIQGLGTCAIINQGRSEGQIPILDSQGKFPISTIPLNSSDSLYLYYTGLDINISANVKMEFNNNIQKGSAITIEQSNIINLNIAGTYLISYNLTSNTNVAAASLISITSGSLFYGSLSRNSSSAAVPYTNCSATFLRTITSPEKIGLKNIGDANLIISSGYCSMNIIKIM
ncbi:MAG: hypothetical protein RSE41_04870 [Clostridia bacterium]